MLTGKSIHSHHHSAETPSLNWVLPSSRCYWASEPGTFSLHPLLLHRINPITGIFHQTPGTWTRLRRAHCPLAKGKLSTFADKKHRCERKGLSFSKPEGNSLTIWSLRLNCTGPARGTKVAFSAQVCDLKQHCFVWHMSLQLPAHFFPHSQADSVSP